MCSFVVLFPILNGPILLLIPFLVIITGTGDSSLSVPFKVFFAFSTVPPNHIPTLSKPPFPSSVTPSKPPITVLLYSSCINDERTNPLPPTPSASSLTVIGSVVTVFTT